MKLLGIALLAASLAADAAGQLRPGEDPTLQPLADRVAGIALDHHGKVALYAEQLGTNKRLAIDGDALVQTASTIKLAILWEAERQVALGKASWDEKITLKPGEAVGGSGMLHLFHAPMTLTLKDAATMMVVVSDNTATNLMIDRFPAAEVDADMTALGLDKTWLYKKVMQPATGPLPADQPKFGLGKSTPRQMVELTRRLGLCELDLPNTPTLDKEKAIAACAIGLEMLRNQFYRDTIPRYLSKLDSSDAGTGIASKTGSLNATRSDVAIIAGKSGPILLAIYTYDNADQSWTADNEGELTIGKLAREIVQTWSPDGMDGKLLKPGLGIDPQATPKQEQAKPGTVQVL